MYFCNCNAIRGAAIEQAIENGCHTYKSAYRACTTEKPQCGQCACDFKQMMEARASASAPVTA